MKTITFFTTFHKPGLDLYGKHWITTFLRNVEKFNPNIFARIYVEGVDVPSQHNKIEFLDFDTTIEEFGITKNTSNNIISYVNGIQTNSVTYAANYNNTEPLRIGLNRSQTNYYKGNISTCKIYLNKSLSSSEILQNYNTIKSRFGLS